MPDTETLKGSLPVRRYIVNVLWSWAGVATTLAVGFFISPFIIRRIGDAGFGLWSLTLSLVEYYWLVDLGFRAATLKYSAQYRAEGNAEKLNELLSTGLVYSTVMGALLFSATLLFASQLGHLLHIEQPVFPTLVRIMGLSWALGLVFGRYTGFLEGFQRFDITNRLWIVSTAARTVVVVILLLCGYGLVEMAWTLLGSQLIVHVMGYVYLRREFPAYDVRCRKASRAMLNQMVRYGVHSLTILVSNRTLSQSTPFLIAYFHPVRFVTYYTVPVKLLDYAMEGIGRIGMITAPSAADLEVKAGRDAFVRLGVYTNRYCLLTFLPVTVLLSMYGAEFMALWIRPDFAVQSAFLFPILLVGGTLLAGQLNSVSILCGIAKHQLYAKLLAVEAVLSVTIMILTVPRFGIIAAGVTATVLMALNRGILSGVLTARVLKVSVLRYFAQIYALPFAAAASAALPLYWMKRAWLPGRTWAELVTAGLVFCALYAVAAIRFAIAPEHREQLMRRVTALK